MNLFTKQKDSEYELIIEVVGGSSGKDRGKGQLRSLAEHVHTTIFKLENQQGPIPYSTWDSAQRYVAAWMGGDFGGEWIHVYVWLSPFPVHLKLSQHC